MADRNTQAIHDKNRDEEAALCRRIVVGITQESDRTAFAQCLARRESRGFSEGARIGGAQAAAKAWGAGIVLALCCGGLGLIAGLVVGFGMGGAL